MGAQRSRLYTNTRTQTPLLSCLQSELNFTHGDNSVAEMQASTAIEGITRCPSDPHWSIIHKAGPKGGPSPSGATAGC